MDKLPFILSGKYFEIIKREGNEVVAMCKNCPSTSKSNAYKGLVNSTSNFHVHLKRKHSALLKQFEKDQDEAAGVAKRRRSENSNLSTINKFLKPDEGNAEFMSMFDRKIIRFIVNGLHPLSIVEEPDFRALFTDESIKVHSRFTYRRRIDAAFQEMKISLMSRMGKAPYLCLTCDIWTCGGMSRSYMGVTAHWISQENNDIARKSAALACRRFKGSHTHDRIAEFISDIMNEFSLAEGKVVKIVTDNGKNFVKAFEVFGTSDVEEGHDSQDETEGSSDFMDLSAHLDNDEEDKVIKLPPHAGCASHTLSLVCTTDIANATVSRINKSAFAKCYGIWNKLSRSTQVAEKIKDVTKISLITPVKTRWNSLYDSIKALLSHRLNLAIIADIASIIPFTEGEITFLDTYCICVEPIAQALDMLQGEKNCFYGSLLPTLIATRCKLEQLKANPPKNANKLPDALLLGLNRRFEKFFSFNSEIEDCIIAAASHPFFKLRWVPEDKVEEVKKIFINAVLKEPLEQADSVLLLEEAEIENSSLESFFGFQHSENTTIQVEKSETTVKQECLNFLLSRKTEYSLLQEYPLIQKVFIKYNTTLPSSAPVERLFSYSSMVLCPKRRRLADDIFEILTVLKVNGF